MAYGFGPIYSASPSVESKEIDASAVTPAQSSSIAGFAGVFSWGPVDQLITVSSEKELASYYGSPSRADTQSFLTGASFLKYGSALVVSRAIGDESLNAVDSGPGVLVKNDEHFEGLTGLTASFIARFPGVIGDSLSVSICSGPDAFVGWIYKDLFDYAPGSTESGDSVFGIDPTLRANDEIHVVVVDREGLFTGTRGALLEKFSGLSLAVDAKTDDGTTLYYREVINNRSQYIRAGAHNAIFDNAGLSLSAARTAALNLTVTTGDRLGYAFLPDIVTTTNYGYYQIGGAGSWIAVTSGDAGTADFYVDNVVKENADGSGATLTAPAVTNTTVGYLPLEDPYTAQLTNGVDDTVDTGDIDDALEQFRDKELVDISLLFAYPFGDGKIIEIANDRKDILGFISAPIEVALEANEAAKLAAVLAKFNSPSYISTSYVCFDSGPLYVYDKYHDRYVWIIGSGHFAGLCANTDEVAEPWFSPAGLNRGGLIDVAKLGFNPSKNSRDALYKARINSFVSFPGQGAVLWGDKTAQSKPSAFDRINVRRLFNYLKKSISYMARYQLFEINDDFTQSQFRNAVEPFLRDVKGRRGVYAYRVICDHTNNTPQVVDTNNFVGEILVQPAKSINNVSLGFIATRTGVNFEEIAG